MQALLIIKTYIVHNIRRRLFRSLKMIEIDHLCFQTMEKGFHKRIVPAMAFSAHADLYAPFLLRSPIYIGGILRSLVGMKDQTWFGGLTLP